jgi:nitroimidazol reductase NimA-like FMN-containing flavoprotein (pyridoxamine 5'-phosphate oxidase superfamily)
MFGTLDAKIIEDLLRNQLIGRLGINGNPWPYVVPVSYAYDGEYVYGFTQEGKKVDLLRQRPEVCFEVEDTQDISNWKTVIAWGRFEELQETALREHAIDMLNKRVLPMLNSETMRLSPFWPFVNKEDTHALPGVVYRIKLEEKTGRYEKSATPSRSYPAV